MAGGGRNRQSGEKVDLDVDGIDERLGQDADDRIWLPIERDHGTENVASPVEMIAPELACQQDCFGPVGEFFFGLERAAERRSDGERIKERSEERRVGKEGKVG